jgi:hypothetical protein
MDNNFIINLYDILLTVLLNFWQSFIKFFPSLVGAIIVFLVGWAIAVVVGKIIAELLKRLKFNDICDKCGIKNALEKAEIKSDMSEFVGSIFKWVLVIVALLATVEVLGFNEFAIFIRQILGYLPNVIVSVLIFIVAVIISDILEKIVKASVVSSGIGYADVVGIIVRWSILITAIMAILVQLRIAENIVNILWTGIVAFLVISGSLAFGLGGKDIAAEILRDLRKKLQR